MSADRQRQKRLYITITGVQCKMSLKINKEVNAFSWIRSVVTV
jgi:hypothetical protein